MYSFYFLLAGCIAATSALTIQRLSSRANTPGKNTTVAAPQYSTFWTTEGKFNGQDLTLLIDTGSSDFWVHGKRAPNPKGSRGVEVIKGQTMKRDYGILPEAYIRGPVVSTKVTIGEISVSNMPVGVGTEMGFGFPLDGFLGLGFKDLNSVRPTKQPTFMMAAQSQLQKPVFTLKLKDSKGGKLSFGSIDREQYKGDLMTSPVNNETHSAWVVDEVTLASGKAKITQPMLFDSGAGPYVYAYSSFVDDYWTQVRGAQKPGHLWIYPCVAKLPDVEISIGDGKNPVTISGSKLKGDEVGSHAKGACIGLLQGVDGSVGSPGVPFFTSAYVVFNQAEPSLSFAAQV